MPFCLFIMGMSCDNLSSWNWSFDACSQLQEIIVGMVLLSSRQEWYFFLNSSDFFPALLSMQWTVPVVITYVRSSYNVHLGCSKKISTEYPKILLGVLKYRYTPKFAQFQLVGAKFEISTNILLYALRQTWLFWFWIMMPFFTLFDLETSM